MPASRADSWGPLDHAAEEGPRALVFLLGFLAPTGRFRYEAGYVAMPELVGQGHVPVGTDEHGGV